MSGYLPLAALREALDGWEMRDNRGNGFTATCPACTGKDGSLKVDVGADGAVAIKCVADCDDTDILAAIGMRLEHLYPHDERPREYIPDGNDKSTLTPFSEITAEPIVWAWHHRIALGKLTGLAGRPKIGKGVFYSWLIAKVTTGVLDGDLGRPRTAIIVTTEDEAGDTLKPRLKAAGADLTKVFTFQMGARSEPVPFRVPQDADALGRRIRQVNAALVVIDPLMEFVDGRLDGHKSQAVRQATAAVNALARDHRCAILTVFHLNKGASTDPLLRQEGSAAFTQVVRGGMLLGQDPDHPEDDDRRVLATTSSNLARLAPSLSLRITGTTVPADTIGTIETPVMDVIGESDATAPDLLGARQDLGDRSALDEAKEFLLRELADGSKPSKLMRADAQELGIAKRTLERANKELGVSAKRSGFGAGGGWIWSLPPKVAEADGDLCAGGDGDQCESPVNTGDSRGGDLQRAPSQNGGNLWAEPPRVGIYDEDMGAGR